MLDGSAPAEKCKNGFYVKGFLCIACNHACTICTGSGENQCSECASGFQLANGNTCVNVCGANQFKEVNGTCSSCAINCSSCLSATECSTCNDKFVLNGFVCQSSCPTGLFNY